MAHDTITVFTDGASRGNPGRGGWGVVLLLPEQKVVELGGRDEYTTNNRMELAAARAALEYIERKKVDGDVEIHTDSAYLLQGVTGWMYGWEKNGWKTSTGEDVLNQDLWKDIGLILFRMKMKRSVSWNKVKGHAGLLGNERADTLATAAADDGQQLMFVGNLKEYEKFIGGSVFMSVGDGIEKKKKASSSEKAYSYVSMIDKFIMTHPSWAECEARVKGMSGAKFKKVFSKLEESALISQWTQENISHDA